MRIMCIIKAINYIKFNFSKVKLKAKLINTLFNYLLVRCRTLP